MTDFDKTLKNVKKIVAFGNTLGEVLEDGKIKLGEWGKLAGKGVTLGSLVKDWDEMKEEIADLDEMERGVIVDTIATDLELPNEKIEAIIEKGIQALVSLADFVKEFK